MIPDRPVSRPIPPGPADVGRAFTLVELLVVVAIVAVLLAILLPTLSRARAHANTIRCASNLRQVCTALHRYAAEFKGKFPPNVSTPAPGQWWHDDARLARDFARTRLPAIGRTALACPEDDGARRSYAMNIWAGSKADPVVNSSVPARGRLWSAGSAGSSTLILVTEVWSSTGSPTLGWSAPPTVGFTGLTPAQRFGALGGFPPVNMGRFGPVTCELAFARHRRPGQAVTQYVEPKGWVNIGFADGHVALLGEADLVDPVTHRLTGRALWTPDDLAITEPAAAGGAGG